MDRKDQPIEVVGAGPSGLVAAITLAHHGYRVVVYEERADVGRRFHGDFQGLENWSTKEDVTDLLAQMGIKINFLCQPYREGNLYDPDLRKVTVRSSEPFFYLVRRGSEPGTLDYGLKAQALEAGVEFVFNKRVEKLPEGGIVAIGPKVADAIVKGVLFEATLPDVAAAIGDDRLAPRAYAYLLVHQGRATLATVILREFRREREFYEKTLAAFRKIVPLDMKHPREFGGYGNFRIPSTAQRDGKLYIGEAAGFQDALFGFGMRYAIVSGHLAARAIIEGKDYDRLWRHELLPRLRTGLVNRSLFELFGNGGYRRLVDYIGRSRDPRELVRRQHDASLFKRLLYPVAYPFYLRRSRFKDYSCSHEDCDCVWCRCQRE